MTTAAPAQDLERRKRLRIRLRKDLVIEAHRYEGPTFYVVKDPISLRYYRLKDNEHFLLQFLDVHHTLEDGQKAYEVEYRPERLRLEDLEAFAHQLRVRDVVTELEAAMRRLDADAWAARLGIEPPRIEPR